MLADKINLSYHLFMGMEWHEKTKTRVSKICEIELRHLHVNALKKYKCILQKVHGTVQI